MSQVQSTSRFVTGSLPVLQTRAPTGNLFGPSVTSLLSRPTMFQPSGVMVRGPGAADAMSGWPMMMTAAAPTAAIALPTIPFPHVRIADTHQPRRAESRSTHPFG